jgi:plasmid stabilization system protein ParE
MMRKITWSPESRDDYNKNIAYLLDGWTEREAQIFIDEVDELVFQLKQGNVDFKQIGYREIRSVKVCDQINLLYRFTPHMARVSRFRGDKL